MKRHIWVVECKYNNKKGWSLVNQDLCWTRDEARWVRRIHESNSIMQFRIRKYIPEDEVGNYIVPTGRNNGPSR